MTIAEKARYTILIVDDEKINRMLLRKILVADYNILEAGNGLEAMEILKSNMAQINAVLLDLVMPVMDGYQFLSAVQDTYFANLPIVVLTGTSDVEAEKKVLEMGASDFVTKPYQPVILQARLRNAIARSQMALFDRIKYIAEHDTLTDLPNRTKFFADTRMMLDEHPKTVFAFQRFDIDQFNLVNSFWGEKEGDSLLCYIADEIKQICQQYPYSTYGRLNSDVFCVCTPYSEETLRASVRQMVNELASYKASYFIKPSIGVYIVDDPKDAVEEMYERAAMAAATVKGKYDQHLGFYNARMHQQLKEEQQIAAEMQKALDEKQFVPWLQPKYDLRTERPYGAEALVRWNHPQKGLVSPGSFIPVFERNGFIVKLDYYMWEQVCILLRKWIDEGYEPAPVSVNISRIDIYNPNIATILSELVHKHQIPPRLLNLELTESAYMDNPEIMKKAVRSLQANGFSILMDDFGSGYSSLNTLKDIPVDTLKIDMNFLKDAGQSDRSKKILASIILMAGWLHLPVIVEGVEHKEQIEFLRDIGCNYAQGYYYGKPMPVADYEQLMYHSGLQNTVQPAASEAVDIVWMHDEVMGEFLNSMHRPLAVYEFDGQNAASIRVNREFERQYGPADQTLFQQSSQSSRLAAESICKLREVCNALSRQKPTDSCVVSIRNAQTGLRQRVTLVLDYIGDMNEHRIIMVMYISAGSDQKDPS